MLLITGIVVLFISGFICQYNNSNPCKMKNLLENLKSIFVLIFFLILLSCKTESDTKLPEVETKLVNEISQTSAKSGGIILSDGGAAITAKGVCWGTNSNPTVADLHTADGSGDNAFESTITELIPDSEYHVRAFATNTSGTAYGDEKIFRTLDNASTGQIIANHSIVSDFDKIPQNYIDLIKKMWLVVAGESHSLGYREGLKLLESAYPAYDVNITESGDPEPYTSTHLRASTAIWGDYNNDIDWIYGCGEEDWFTNALGISRIKAGITYSNTHNLEIGAFGFGWCWDATAGSPTASVDPVYGVHWYGWSYHSPEGDIAWGLDDADNTVTGNSINLDSYLEATQEYIDYCTSNGYSTKVFFTTGSVDIYNGESGYQGYLKYQRIRDFVAADPSRILFDYADILCYDDNGALNTETWNGHTYPFITSKNLNPVVDDYHISQSGALRLAKAMWWMLARISGWDGN